ncbi:MAG: diacylglycerol kinase family lipid kinase [Clostridiales bacterium]|nr:diacylglycerol kinase family lipid kinase [Clostridiales bacterium]
MYHFIINPHSKTGHAMKYWKELSQILDNRKVKYQAYFTKQRKDATNIARKICEDHKGIKKIIIVGGDGTANEVINGLNNNNEILLGYIPLGSSNDLARGLKLPKDPKAALEIILNPKEFRYVDHGTLKLNDTKQSCQFAVSSGIGYDAAVCNQALTSPLKHLLNKLHMGKLVYILIAIKQIFVHQPAKADIIIDDHRHIHTDRLIFMASMIQKYEGGGLPMCPTAKDNDQKLTICLVTNMKPGKVLLLMPSIFFGKHIHFRGIQMIDCRKVEVKTNKPMVVHTDGEIVGFHDDITLSCTPTQIRMFSR